MSKQLWNKGTPVNQRMQQLCTGNDPEIDLALVVDDCVGSAAHARMLEKVGLLSKGEADSLVTALAEIYAESSKGAFRIPVELEDMHTAIELRLTEQLADAGKKIHTGRSRNDQILVALRLYQRRSTSMLCEKLVSLGTVIVKRFDDLGAVPMPGYTHQQPAMPSTVGFWLHGVLEGVLTLLRGGEKVLERIDSCPLGAGAGFGSSLPLDRELSAKLLGFSRVQRSPVDAMNSRGWYDLMVVQWCAEIALLLEKVACDLAFGLLRETGFFVLDEALCTGSSIMPQKRNPDLVELLRAKPAKIRSAAFELGALVSKLPSSYHRDYQYTKEPLLRAVEQTTLMLEMCELLFSNFSVNQERCKAAMYDELFATYEANRLVAQGTPFREAYGLAAAQHQQGKVKAQNFAPELEQLRTTTARDFSAARGELTELEKGVQGRGQKIKAVVHTFFPRA